MPVTSGVRINWVPAVFTFFSYTVLIVFGKITEYFVRFFLSNTIAESLKGKAPLYSSAESFFLKRMRGRVNDCFERAISSSPGAWMDVIDRNESSATYKQTITSLNLGSYNYLGFADPNSPCQETVINTLRTFSVSSTSFRCDIGNTVLHEELEHLVADFVGKPAALLFGQGFSTNSTAIPSIIGKNGVLISDSINHNSIVFGSRLSGATVKVFSHNDMKDLERVIRDCIIYGHPRTRRPFTKIVIMIEGIYSMEGEFCCLNEIVALKKKYKCYLYIDEAHSIGCVGATGRGVCEYMNVNPEDVDVLMGTFSKSFAACGGYVAGSKKLIDYMRATSAGYNCSANMSPPAAMQVIASLKIIAGLDGTDLGKQKLIAIKENSNFFRESLINMGLSVMGMKDSPVIPVLMLLSTKVTAFSRECLARKIAVVIVGFPATPVLLARCRFCISSAHSIADLRKALEQIEEVAKICHIRYERYAWG